MRILLFSLIIFSSIYAQEQCIIGSDTTYKDCKKSIQIFTDQNHTYSMSNPPPQNLFLEAKRTSLGLQFYPVWTKLTLKNDSNKTKEILLVNPRAGMDEIAVLIYQGNRLIGHEMLGDTHPIEDKRLYHHYGAINLEFQPFEEITIVSRLKNNLFTETTWVAISKDLFARYSYYDLLVWGFYYGLLLALIIYSINNYLILKNRVFIFYALMGMSYALNLASYNGTLYMLSSHLTLNNTISWIFVPLTTVFMLLFSKDFFMTPTTMPLLNKFLSFAITVMSIVAVVLSFGYLFFEDYYTMFLVKKYSLYTLMLYLLPLVIGIIAIKNKLKGAVFYTIGQGIYAFSIFYTAIVNGFAPSYMYSTLYSPLAGSIIDLIFLSFALSQYFRYLKYTNERNEKLLITQSTFSTIGKSIGHITHQWRYPISLLNGSITVLESVFRHKKEHLSATFEEQLPALKRYIKSLENTLNDFSSFYTFTEDYKEYLPVECINNATQLLHSKIILKNVLISLDIPKNLKFYGQENIFSNIMLILIDNSLDAFKTNHNNLISITIKENGDLSSIIYEDNAGGITIKPIEKVFDYFVTTKKDNAPHGFGLAITKLLIEDKLGGKISVTNTIQGTCFEIIILLRQKQK